MSRFEVKKGFHMIVWMIRLNREKDAELTIDGILIDFRVFRKNLNVLIFKRF